MHVPPLSLHLELTRIRSIQVYLLASLLFPEDWPAVANQFAYPNFVTILKASRAYGFTDPYILPENFVGPPQANSSVPPPRAHRMNAIPGADGAASDGVPLKEVFDDIVAATRDHIPTRVSSIFITLEDPWIDQGLQSVPSGPQCT